MKHLTIRIHGNVQGVTYRHSAWLKAKQLHIVGYVRNEPDGSVIIEAEGKPNQLEHFTKWCHTGPLFAQVRDVEVSKGQLKNYSNFTICHS